MRSRPDCQTIPPPQYYSQLITEMQSLGWDKYVIFHLLIHLAAAAEELVISRSTEMPDIFNCIMTCKLISMTLSCSIPNVLIGFILKMGVKHKNLHRERCVNKSV